MSDTQITSDNANAAALRDLQQEVQSLRSFVLGLVVVLIVLSGAVNLFFLRQASMVNAQLALQLQENKANIDEFNTRTGPALVTFWKNVNEFAKANPDLVPILAKYNFTPGPGSPAAQKK